jgi:hypothetical protein
MRFNIAILIALILALAALTSTAMAGDPLKKDKLFLNSDPDGDGIETWEEFTVGTDPFNTDSDNDGLPDWWELEYSHWKNPDPNALLDPTDSSDAHGDLDYDAVSNGTGFNQGEREAEFKAIQQLKGGQPVSWPSDPDMLFTQPAPGEDGPHYDNYEEYYRPYTDLVNENVIRYMHTNPTKPDTDGDLILDPDDYEPLGWANDGVSPGGNDVPEIAGTSKNTPTQKDTDNVPEQHIEAIVPSNFDIDIEQTPISNSNPKTSSTNNKNEYLPDIDNDGI